MKVICCIVTIISIVIMIMMMKGSCWNIIHCQGATRCSRGGEVVIFIIIVIVIVIIVIVIVIVIVFVIVIVLIMIMKGSRWKIQGTTRCSCGREVTRNLDADRE